ncbi:unnamed protein product, partial [Mesorhabditis belari]|uniref:Transthyretin-like family protein n=1 Tax=Mesorhabditis belari TaxID=2138241 RepID=A0AAF3FPK3_9BILA
MYPTLIFLLFPYWIYAVVTNITVIGTVGCSGKKMAGVKVELYDRDVLSYNDKLATVTTNRDGSFVLAGSENEKGLEPFVLFYHTCRAAANCWRVTHYDIPKGYDNRVFDMSLVTLDMKTSQAAWTNVTVTGMFVCGIRVQRKGIRVELWEHDIFDPNDKLDETISAQDGTWTVSGGEDEFGSIDAFILIYHRCGLERTPHCHRISQYWVPKRFYNSVYKMGIVGLDLYTENDTSWFDPNDKLDETSPAHDGTWTVFGGEDEFGSIDAFILIYHRCGLETSRHCHRISQYWVPKRFYNSVYNMSLVGLDLRTKNDTTWCRNLDGELTQW